MARTRGHARQGTDGAASAEESCRPDLHWRIAAGRLSPVLYFAMDRCHQGVVRDFRQKSRAVESAAKDEDVAWRLEAIGQNVATIRFTPSMARYVCQPAVLVAVGYSADELVGKHHRSSATRTTRPLPPTCFWKELAERHAPARCVQALATRRFADLAGGHLFPGEECRRGGRRGAGRSPPT